MGTHTPTHTEEKNYQVYSPNVILEAGLWVFFFFFYVFVHFSNFLWCLPIAYGHFQVYKRVEAIIKQIPRLLTQLQQQANILAILCNITS